jgi:hypothetical protein
MANEVRISKHSAYKIQVILSKDTMYYLNKEDTEVFSEASLITIKDKSRNINFQFSEVIIPVGNTVLETVTLIQGIIES